MMQCHLYHRLPFKTYAKHHGLKSQPPTRSLYYTAGCCSSLAHQRLPQQQIELLVNEQSFINIILLTIESC